MRASQLIMQDERDGVYTVAAEVGKPLARVLAHVAANWEKRQQLTISKLITVPEWNTPSGREYGVKYVLHAMADRIRTEGYTVLSTTGVQWWAWPNTPDALYPSDGQMAEIKRRKPLQGNEKLNPSAFLVRAFLTCRVIPMLTEAMSDMR